MEIFLWAILTMCERNGLQASVYCRDRRRRTVIRVKIRRRRV